MCLCRYFCFFFCCCTSRVTRWSRASDAGIARIIYRWTRMKPPYTGLASGCAQSPWLSPSARPSYFRCLSPATRYSFSTQTATTSSGLTAPSFKVRIRAISWTESTRKRDFILEKENRWSNLLCLHKSDHG